MDRLADIILTPIALFSGRPLAVALALGILAAALALWLAALLPVERRFVGALRRIAKALRALRLTEGSQEQHFAAADAVFDAGALAPVWRRYRSSVEFDDGKALAYSDPADFFSLAYLPGHGYPKWSSTLAGVFLTVGLFFTFVGLSAALLKLGGGEGHDSLNPAELKVAVEGILAVSSVKFISSIAGILAYIFWSVVARQQSATQARAEEELLEELRALSTYVAPEMLLRRQLRLAESLPQTIASSVGASVAEALAPIRDEISAMNTRVGRANENVAESAGAAFGAQMQDGIGRHLDSFGERIGAALAALDTLPEKFRATEAGFGGQIGQGAEQLNASAMRMAAAIEQSQAGLAATLADFDRKLAAIPGSVATAAESSALGMSAAMRETLDGVAQSAAEANRVGAQAMFARVDEISGALTAVAALLTQAGQQSGAQMAEGAQKFTASAETTAARLSQTIDGFTLAVNRLTTRLDQTENAIDGHTRRLSEAGETVTGASNDLAKAAAAMESSAGAMEGAATPLTTATSSFRDALSRFAEATDRMGAVSASGDAIAAHIASFGAQMTHSLAAFDALPEKIRATEAGFGGQIGQSAEQLNASALRMAAAIEQSQAGLAATLADFDRKLAAIPASVASATENSTLGMSAAMRETLDGVAQSAAEANRVGAQAMFARVDEISGALTAVAALLTQAGQQSGAQMAEGAQKFTASAETTAARLSQTIDGFTLAVNRLTTRLDQTENAIDGHTRRLSEAGETVTGASNDLAKAAAAMESSAGAMEGAAAPLTTATYSFRDALSRFSEATDRIGAISASGDAIAAHIASFGTQMTHSLAAFDALPEKIRATESGFGGEIGRSANELTQAAMRMSAGFERGQSALAATLAAFQSKIETIPTALKDASESTSREIGAKVRETLDEAASVAARATSGGADILALRVDEISRSLTTAADRLLHASTASGEHFRASHGSLTSGLADGVKIISDTAENSAALLARTVETFAVAVRGLSAKLGEVSLGIDAQNARLEKAGIVVSGASDSLVEAAGSVASAATPLTKASTSLHGALDKFSGAAEQIRVLSDSGRQVVENFERTATAAQSALGSQADNFRSVERAVGQTLDELVRGVQSLGQEISQCIETYDNEIAKSIGSLEAALIDVGDIVDTRSSRRAETR